MDIFRRHGHLLRADGTNQLQRLLPGLEAGYIVPDERSFADLIEYAYRVAAEIRYYDLSGQTTGDWRPLLELLVDSGSGRMRSAQEPEMQLAVRADWPPHLVLLLVFLKQYRHLQDDLNRLPERHLLHYDEYVLGLQRRAAIADEAHVVFELARNAPATLLPAGTALDAAKDAQGRPLAYATQTEVLVSAAAVTSMRRLAVERDRRNNRRFFVAEGFTPLEGLAGYTFGRRQLDLDPAQRFMTEAPLGFAVAAPILGLAEGERRLTVLAHLRLPPSTPPLVTQGIGYALDVSLSGAKGWLVPDTVQADLLADGAPGQAALSLTVTLGAAAPAVIAFNSALHGPGMVADRPVLRCLIKGETGIYELLDGLVVEKVDFSVEVKGVRKLVVQNADGPLSASAPLPLFGSQPQIGSTFHVGSAEVFGKRLSSLALHLQWKSPPDDLFDQYRAYFDAADSALTDLFHTLFRVDVDLLYDGAFRPLLFNQTLFSPVPADPKAIEADASAFGAALAGSPYVEQPDLKPPVVFDPDSKYGFVRMVLIAPRRSDLAAYAQVVPFEAFGHAAFARRYAQQAIALSKYTPPGPKPLLPGEPYLPVLKSLALDYAAHSQLIPGDRHAVGAFLMLGPFGATPARGGEGARLVPQVDGSAAMFLGVGKMHPPANLSMLFQIDPGSAGSADVLQAGDAEWSYFGARDVWQRLNSSAVLVDSTQGFQKPGLVTIGVPRDASLTAQSLPSGLVWLRCLIRRPPESAARTLAIKTHAALARFQPGSLPLADYGQHLESGLPAGTISKLAQRNGNIKRVEQPDPSFGGRAEEKGADYFRRSSERLRHRRRAVTPWDIERLVLEAFPEVFKVKCLAHTDADGLPKPGHIALVIVPNLRRTGAANVLEPRAGTVLLGRIGEYLAALESPFATTHVIAPVFERIRVEAYVVFARGRDPGYHAGMLNDDLRRFLSPWAYREGEDILFGARIYRSEILAFIEFRDYVDHVTVLNLYHSFAGQARSGIGWMTIGVDFFIRPNPRPGVADMIVGDDFVVGRGVEVAETTQAHAILVSHPEHLITPVAPGTEACPGVTRLGIGYMTVGLDFNLQPETTV